MIRQRRDAPFAKARQWHTPFSSSTIHRPDDAELLNRVFRAAHPLKGNSKILGFETVAKFTHELENLLDRLRKRELFVTQNVADTLLASLDVLNALLAEIGGGAPHDPISREQVSQRIGALVVDLQAELEPKEEHPLLDFGPSMPPEKPVVAPSTGKSLILEISGERRISTRP